jgi:hypothetical protein
MIHDRGQLVLKFRGVMRRGWLVTGRRRVAFAKQIAMLLLAFPLVLARRLNVHPAPPSSETTSPSAPTARSTD